MAIKKIGLLNSNPDGERVTMTKIDRSAEQTNESPDESLNSQELTEELVLESLKQVRDPELPVDIVNLGLIYDISLSGRNVLVKLTLTTPGCHMARTICEQAERVVKTAGAKDVMVEIVWDPPWNPDMMSDEAKAKLGMS